MNRREFLQCAAMLAAGTTAMPASWAMNDAQKVFLAAQANYIDRKPLTFFSPSQRALVTTIAEHVIPKTDTPGASDAGVPRFIELMASDWFNAAELQVFMDGLTDLQSRADGGFIQLDSTAQLALLEQLEKESADAPWYELGNVLRVWDDTAPFICQFKELTVLGFFLSEVGSKQVLRINPMGEFKGDIPLATDDPAYAAELPTRMLTES
jgi:gluconate 2-dehydrogenase gamma chain